MLSPGPAVALDGPVRRHYKSYAECLGNEHLKRKAFRRLRKTRSTRAIWSRVVQSREVSPRNFDVLCPSPRDTVLAISASPHPQRHLATPLSDHDDQLGCNQRLLHVLPSIRLSRLQCNLRYAALRTDFCRLSASYSVACILPSVLRTPFRPTPNRPASVLLTADQPVRPTQSDRSTSVDTHVDIE